MAVYTVDMSFGFASTIGAYDTTEYSGLYSERELLYVDKLNSNGFCASYSEMRRFLTSVALKEEDSIKEGVYFPDGIVPVCQGGCLIQKGC
jgi:hypothetical protein